MGSSRTCEASCCASISQQCPRLLTPPSQTILAARDLARHPSEDFNFLRRSTMVNKKTLMSPADRHENIVNTTPTLLANHHHYPLPTATTPTSRPKNSHSHSPPASTSTTSLSKEEHSSKTITAASCEKATFGPHKKWKTAWALSSVQMFYAYEEGIIPLPEVSAEDLNDGSKGDALVKRAAVL